MEQEKNVVSLYETIRDRNGKKHRIYSVRFKDLQTVVEFTEKYNPDGFGYYAMAPVLDDDGEVMRNADGSINYDNGFLDDLYEIVELALDHKENRAQIEEWLDLAIAKEVIMVFLGLSQFKKKLM